ncbi:hypothetical protein ACLB1G_21065 [Oxalobacteraceae bacterium A2-2]
MQEITGILGMLGSGVVIRNAIGKSFVKFDTIEIGGRVLQKMTTARSLEDFMTRGLGSEVTLYLAGKSIVGVRLGDGKLYYWSRSKTTVIMVGLLALGVGAMLFGGLQGGVAGMLALLAFWAYLYALFRNEFQHILQVQPKLAAQGGIPLKS